VPGRFPGFFLKGYPMQSVFKYPIGRKNGWFTISMHDGARILDAQTQHGTAVLWAVVDTSKPQVRRTFAMIGTGYELPFEVERTCYIGTVQFSNGDEVYHIFEKVA
jgi:hypothetical protein